MRKLIKKDVLKMAFLYANNRKTGVPNTIKQIIRHEYENKNIVREEFEILFQDNNTNGYWEDTFDIKCIKPSREAYRILAFCALRGCFRCDVDINTIKNCLTYIEKQLCERQSWEIKIYITDIEKEMTIGYQKLFGKWKNDKKKIFNDFINTCKKRI